MNRSAEVQKEKTSGSRYGSVLQKLALVIWVALIVFAFINRDKITPEAIASYEPQNLLLAVLMMMGLFALKTLSVVFYSGLLFTVSGMLFDLPVAIAVIIAGALVMLLEGYGIGHMGGQQLVEDLSKKYPKFGEFTGLKDSNPFLFALLIRTLKVVNYDLGSMYMGASGVKLLPYLGGSLLALLPELTLFALAGSGISDMNAMPAVYAAVLYVVMTVGSALILRHMMKVRNIKDQK